MRSVAISLFAALAFTARLTAQSTPADSAAVQFAAVLSVVDRAGKFEQVVFERRAVWLSPTDTGAHEHSALLLGRVQRETRWRTATYRDVVQCDSVPRPRCQMVNTDLYVAVSTVDNDSTGASVDVLTYRPNPVGSRMPMYGVGYRVLVRRERGGWIVVKQSMVWQT